MKTFTKRAAIVTGLLFTALICCGIVYIDTTKHFLQASSGFVRLVVNNRTILTVETNAGAVQIVQTNGGTAIPFAVGRTNGGPTNVFQVETNGGLSTLSWNGGGGPLTVSPQLGGIVNLQVSDTANASFTAQSGGHVSGLITDSDTNTWSGGSAGEVFLRQSASTNINILTSSGGRLSGRLNTVHTLAYSTGSTGSGLSHLNITSFSNLTVAVAKAISLWATYNGGVNVVHTLSTGGFQMTDATSISNASFTTTFAGNIWMGGSGIVSNTISASLAGSVHAWTTNSFNTTLHAHGGAFINIKLASNTDLRSSNGGFIIGAPPAGTTNRADASGLVYGDVSIMATKGLSIGTNGANAAFVTNILASSAALDFPSTAAGTFSDLPITVTGVTSNNCAVSLSIPWQMAQTGGGFTSFASNDAIYLRFVNNQLVAAIDPAPGVVSVVVFRIR